MPGNKRRIAVTAPYDRWVLLGKLLEGRRHVLGYTYRAPGFERDREINRRLAADLETAARKRVDHFSEGTLRRAAHGYEVTYDSMTAVLRGEADALAPVPSRPGGDVEFLPPPLPPSPFIDAARTAADRPYATAIWDRVLDLPRRVSLTAAQVGLSGDDAKAWDGNAKRFSLADLVWLVADLQRQAGDTGNPGAAGAAGA